MQDQNIFAPVPNELPIATAQYHPTFINRAGPDPKQDKDQESPQHRATVRSRKGFHEVELWSLSGPKVSLKPCFVANIRNSTVPSFQDPTKDTPSKINGLA